jgi:hypothetical protein
VELASGWERLITGRVPDAHMAMVILTGLYLLSVEQVPGRDVSQPETVSTN